jgi:hypothetical protein
MLRAEAFAAARVVPGVLEPFAKIYGPQNVAGLILLKGLPDHRDVV